MIRFSFTANTRDLRYLSRTDKLLQKALYMAKKDTMRLLKNEAARQVSAQYWLTQKQVKEAIREEPAGIRVRSGMLSLEKYKISPTHPAGGKRKLLGAVKRSGGLKPLGNAFLRPARGGGFKPYMRPSNGKGRPKLITGPSIAQTVGNPEIMERLQARAGETFQNRADFYVSRLGIFAPKGGWR
ncbi:MAG: hypothetical protein IJR85_04710 [Synergistaceae bacterium]|nr:hypothetical protein [Synergistaceae bacterium]